VHAGTVAELLDRWLEQASPSWSPSTRRETTSLVEHHLKVQLGSIALAELTTADIDAFYTRLLREGGRDGQPLAAGTVHRVHVVLHRALAQAHRWGWIWLNPASTASPPRVEPSEIVPPNQDELARLLAEAERVSSALHLFLLLAATTGQRRGELLALRWGDVDFERANLKIQRSLTEGPSGPVLSPTKTRRTNCVALDAATAQALAAFRSRLSLDAATAARFVFSSDGGSTPWLPNRVTKAFIRCRRAVGLDSFRLHDLRHFMATDMLANGEPVTVVSSRLSHARTSTTLNVYGHVVPGADRSAAEALALRLAPLSVAKATTRDVVVEGGSHDEHVLLERLGS
jgi:integrase